MLASCLLGFHSLLRFAMNCASIKLCKALGCNKLRTFCKAEEEVMKLKCFAAGVYICDAPLLLILLMYYDLDTPPTS